MNKHEFDVKMKTGDMFAFMLRQQYFGTRGIIFLLFLVIVLGFSVFKWDNMDQTARVIIIFVLFIFLVFSPIQLFLKAKLQAVSAERFQMATHYAVTEEGITISQSGEVLELLWGHLAGYKKSSKRIYVYTTRVSAIIMPKDQIGEENYAYLLTQLAAHKKEFLTKSLETAKHIVPQDETEEDEETVVNAGETADSETVKETSED